MKRILSVLVPLCLAASLNAMANEAVVGADTSLLAGPDVQYPAIAELPAGSPVQIEGCIDGWTWCDVVAGGDRGWVPGTFLVEDFENQRVIVTDYGPRIRIPIVVFSLDTYWGEHYRARPWYAQRMTWRARAIRPRPPARPVNININIGFHTGAHPGDHHDGGGDHGGDGNHHDDGNHNVRPIRPGHPAQVTHTKTTTVTTNRTQPAPRPKAQPKPQDKPKQNDQGSGDGDGHKDKADNH